MFRVTIAIPDKLTYEYLSENREYLLNLISVSGFLDYLRDQ